MRICFELRDNDANLSGFDDREHDLPGAARSF
jgi:hypothetical protein